MKLYLTRAKNNVSAIAEYSPEDKTFIVLKGSIVSDHIAYSEKFRGAKTIERIRKEYVKDWVVSCDVPFKSASTAANFVTGSSTNGLSVWKDETGKKLKDIHEGLSTEGGKTK
mgnify:CR=1 FL=1